MDFFASWQKKSKKSNATHTKDLCGKNVPKSQDFKENIS
jgi:hypothetical protein